VLGLEVLQVPARVEETAQPGETAAEQVVRLAGEKALQVHRQRPDGLVLAADTLVVASADGGERRLGKPVDRQEARAMLHLLSGREHQVLTGVALCRPDGRVVTELGITLVAFAPLPARLIDWYIATREPYDKAGGYAAQGKAALFIERLEGSWTNVVGLPLERLPALFAAAGIDIADLLGAPGGS